MDSETTMDFATAETILRSGEQALPARPHRIGREGMGTVTFTSCEPFAY